jgi:opacity protein-like surface antigen
MTILSDGLNPKGGFMKLLVLFVSLILSMPVFADRYLAASMGLSDTDHSIVRGDQQLFDRGHFSFAYGWVLDEWRIEVGTNFLPLEFEDSSVEVKARTHTLLVNAYKDFSHGDKWGTFIGAGIGGAYNKVEIPNVGSDSKYTVAGQVTLGLKYMANKDTEFTFDYRLLGFDDGPHDGIHTLNIGIHKHI